MFFELLSLFEFHVDCAAAGWLAVPTTQRSPENIEALLNRQCNLPGRDPPAFSAPSHRDHHHDSRLRFRDDRDDAPTPGALSLPRARARPPFTDIARDALLAAAPELSNVAAEFVRHGLRAKARRRPPVSQPWRPPHLPPALTPPCRDSKGKKGEGSATRRTVFPVHAVVLAAYCAKIPRLLPSAPSAASRTASAMLPVLPLTLLPRTPSPSSMPSCTPTASPPPFYPPPLLPLAPPRTRTPALARTERSSPTPPSARPSPPCPSSPPRLAPLRRLLLQPEELCKDMVALGVYDPELWNALDLAWEVVLGALDLSEQ
ncbi:hypothetical protein DFH09DRAFT_1277166 [Mycena vulgaris]|nr:hypothetical protein DFH09DRAFT_1277166 [Mycena vulgaris]